MCWPRYINLESNRGFGGSRRPAIPRGDHLLAAMKKDLKDEAFVYNYHPGLSTANS